MKIGLLKFLREGKVITHGRLASRRFCRYQLPKF